MLEGAESRAIAGVVEADPFFFSRSTFFFHISSTPLDHSVSSCNPSMASFSHFYAELHGALMGSVQQLHANLRDPRSQHLLNAYETVLTETFQVRCNGVIFLIRCARGQAETLRAALQAMVRVEPSRIAETGAMVMMSVPCSRHVLSMLRKESTHVCAANV